MKNFSLSLLFLALAVTAGPAGYASGAGGSENAALLGLINEGYFSTPQGKLVLYRGIGSLDTEMNHQHEDAMSQREFRKWLSAGGPAEGMAADNDSDAMSFTVSLAYAGRYTGVQAWDRDRGIIKLEIPLDKLRAMKDITGRPNELEPDTWALLYDTPGSVSSTGRDVFDGLPFMGTLFPGKSGEIRSICTPADWIGQGNCPALEVRLSIGTIKKLGASLSLKRVTWAEYDAARQNLIARKSSVMKQMNLGNTAKVKQAADLWKAEAAFYSLLCDAGKQVCPGGPVTRAALCARLLALPRNHYLMRLPEDSPETEMLLELIGKKVGPVFKGADIADIAGECRSGAKSN